MTEVLSKEQGARKVSPVERIFTRSPYAIVTMVARIKGEITEEQLKNAVSKVQKRHYNLRVRIVEDENHDFWFTPEGVHGIPIEVVARQSNDQWMQVYHKACPVPFEFEKRPPIKFILVQSSTISELVIFCHHLICDGFSLAFLSRDILEHLGDPNKDVEVLADPLPVNLDTIPAEVSPNFLIKFFINRFNKKWQKEPIYFNQQDYESLTAAYWKRYKHCMISIELSESETSALVDRCRKEQVTVNSAISTAFAGAQKIIDTSRFNSNIAVAGSLRNRLTKPVGEEMGFYAGAVTLKFDYDEKKDFWENGRAFHKKITSLYTNKKLFDDPMTWSLLNPCILESRDFKVLGKFVSPDEPNYSKLSSFAEKEDFVYSLLKREKIESIKNILLGTAITNLTRMDFPKTFGSLELDRLIMNPGGAFPLPTVRIVVGAVTASGKLSILLEYAKETVDTATMEKIKDQATDFLLNE